MLLRAVLKVVTCAWVCRSAMACWVPAVGWTGCGVGRRSPCFLAGFFLVVSTVMVGNVPGPLGAGCACGASGAGGVPGVCAKAKPPRQQQSETNAELLRSRPRPLRIDI